jgi:hypothetical protein
VFGIFKAEGYGWDSGRIAIAQRSQKAAGYIIIEHCSTPPLFWTFITFV